MASQKSVSKYNYLKADELFEEVSNGCNYIDKDLVRMVYYELVRTMSKELKSHGMVRMPDWGDFTLVLHKARRSRHVITGDMIQLPAMKTVKYSPDKKLKNYFHSI